jgi:hypothetical protein
MAAKAAVKENSKPKLLYINDAAKIKKVTPATLRGKLRRAKVKKNGTSYSWTSVAAMNKDLGRLTA